MINAEGCATAQHQRWPAIDSLGIPKHLQLTGVGDLRNRVVADERHRRFHGIEEFAHQSIGAATCHCVQIGVGQFAEVTVETLLKDPNQSSCVAILPTMLHEAHVRAHQAFMQHPGFFLLPPGQ